MTAATLEAADLLAAFDRVTFWLLAAGAALFVVGKILDSPKGPDQ